MPMQAERAKIQLLPTFNFGTRRGLEVSITPWPLHATPHPPPPESIFCSKGWVGLRVGKISLQPGFNPRAVQPEASRIGLVQIRNYKNRYIFWNKHSVGFKNSPLPLHPPPTHKHTFCSFFSLSFSYNPPCTLCVLSRATKVSILQLATAGNINPLNTKRRLLYLKTQFVPRSKHFSSRL